MADDTEEAAAIPEILTFAQGRDLLADDLKRIGDFFYEAEKDCREGDTGAYLKMIDNLSNWRMMLALRYEDRMSRIEGGRSKPKNKIRA